MKPHARMFWLIGWLDGRFVGWLFGCLAGWLVGRLLGELCLLVVLSYNFLKGREVTLTCSYRSNSLYFVKKEYLYANSGRHKSYPH